MNEKVSLRITMKKLNRFPQKKEKTLTSPEEMIDDDPMKVQRYARRKC